MSEGCVRNPRRTLDIVEASEDDLESPLCLLHETLDLLQHLIVLPAVRFQKGIGLINQQ